MYAILSPGIYREGQSADSVFRGETRNHKEFYLVLKCSQRRCWKPDMVRPYYSQPSRGEGYEFKDIQQEILSQKGREGGGREGRQEEGHLWIST